MENLTMASQNRLPLAHVKPGQGSSVLQGSKRVPFGEISTNTNSLPAQRSSWNQNDEVRPPFESPGVEEDGDEEEFSPTWLEDQGFIGYKNSLSSPILPKNAEDSDSSEDDLESVDSCRSTASKLNDFQRSFSSPIFLENSEFADSSEEELESVDIFRSMESKPSTVSDCFDEYTLEIITNARKAERQYLPKVDYMDEQRDLTYEMRSILVDWLVDVAKEYTLHSETIFIAVNLIDRFLSFKSVLREKFQLVGTTCMWIAAKFEEVNPPDVNEFCFITEDSYTNDEVYRMERLVLKTLGMKCSVPTPHFYVTLFSKVSGVPEKSNVTYFARYLTELTLLDAETYQVFTPSIIGAASLALARHSYGLPAWDTDLMEKSGGMRVSDFKVCIARLYETSLKASENPQQAVFEKYKDDKFNRVACSMPKPFF